VSPKVIRDAYILCDLAMARVPIEDSEDDLDEILWAHRWDGFGIRRSGDQQLQTDSLDIRTHEVSLQGSDGLL
jgi:hypothetical protein